METNRYFLNLLSENTPDAVAVLEGAPANEDINGIIKFYSLPESGLLIAVEISDLPDGADDDAPTFFAFHIHETGDCSGNFSNTGNHYNPERLPHPEHAGDLPPLFANDGYVWMIFYDSFLTLPQILNRSVVIHQNPDDFSSQPSGNSGSKIACGVIRANAGNIPPLRMESDKWND